MITDPTIREQGYSYFLSEAQDLLQEIEHGLLNLREDHPPAKVHNLMRATHTLKGAAASVGFESIKTIAHSLEDVFKALYNPEVIIDLELEALLVEAYDCLRLPLTAAIAGKEGDDPEVLHRATSIFAHLQEKLGDAFDPQAPIPSSIELGFDITQSIFETGVSDRLEQLATLLAGTAAEGMLASELVPQIAQTLQTQAEVFVGLAESLNLPGFGAIAQAAIAAAAAHPEQTIAVAQTALTDFRQGQAAVLAGDRTRGGEPSLSLQQLAGWLPTTPPTSSHPALIEVAVVGSANQVNPTSEPVAQPIPVPVVEDVADSYVNQIEPLQNSETSNLRKPDGVLTRFINFLNRPLWSKSRDSQVKIDDATQELPSEQLVNTQEVSSAVSEEIIFDSGPKKLAEDVEIAVLHDAADPLLDAKLEQYVNDFEWVAVESEDNHQPPQASEIEDQQTLDFDQSELENLEQLTDFADVTPESLIENIWGTQGSVALTPDVFTENKVDSSLGPSTGLEQELDQKSAAILIEESALNHQPSSGFQPAARFKETAPRSTTVRVNLEHLEKLNHSVGELLINQNQQALQDERLQKLIQELLDGLKQHQQTMTQLRDWSDRMLFTQARGQQFVVIPQERAELTSAQKNQTSNLKLRTTFDELELDRHSELHVLLQSALEEGVQLETATETIDFSVKQSSQTLKKQGRLLANARDDLMEARMIPIEEILNRFPRLLQQLMEIQGKPVDLKLQGTRVLVDKAVAEKLYDPLLHLIRNAFDHGIELPEVRRQQGKPEVGQIEIFAYQQGNKTVIEVKDDGQGLNLGQICRRGFELQLLPSDQVEQFSQAELLDLLFEPGFSTAAQVSDLSGRGVGLDVVRSQLRSLKGSVTVSSTPYKGTTFTLQLPLTLMSARLLVCQVGQVAYALLSDAVEKILLPQADQIEQLAGQRVLHWQQEHNESLVPIFQLSDLVGYSSPVLELAKAEQHLGSTRNSLLNPALQGDSRPLILLRCEAGLLGLEVDQIIGEQELVIRPVGTTIMPPPYVYGCSILGDGRLTLVIDGVALAKQSLNQALLGLTTNAPETQSVALLAPAQVDVHRPPYLTDQSGHPDPNQKCLLVIDDSVTLRQTLTLTLQNAGYQVLQAQDGLEAIAQLQQHQEDIQLITCDIEMPRLNGFEFLMRYSQEPALAKIPVVMLTSRSSEKHRQLALELGAAAYLTKPYVEQELLATITDLIKPAAEICTDSWRS